MAAGAGGHPASFQKPAPSALESRTLVPNRQRVGSGPSVGRAFLPDYVFFPTSRVRQSTLDRVFRAADAT